MRKKWDANDNLAKRSSLIKSFNFDANGALPRARYNRALYGDLLATEMEQDSSRNWSPRKKTTQNSLGSLGAISDVIRELPVEIMLERRVYGPAYSRAEEGEQNVAHYDDHDKETRSPISRRAVDNNLIRDDIMFLYTLEETVTARKHMIDIAGGADTKSIMGTQYDRSKLIDEGHLPVKDQLSERLVHIDVNGNVVKDIPTACASKMVMQDDDKKSQKLNQKVNTRLRDALKEYKFALRSAAYRDHKAESTNSTIPEQRNIYKFCHRALVPSFLQKINAFVQQHKLQRNVVSDHDRDISRTLLFESVDDLDIHSIRKALKEGADAEVVMNGCTAFQTIFRRICKMDCGQELRWNISQHERVLDELIGWGSDLNSNDCEHSWNGFSPIHYAVRYGHIKRLNWLIHRGAHIDRRSISGLTPLMIACERGAFEHIYTLVKNGADFDDSDRKGRTVLHYAAAGGNVNALRFLIECGSQGKATLCNAGETPISICSKVNKECYDYLTKAKLETQASKTYIDAQLEHNSPNEYIQNKAAKIIKGFKVRKGLSDLL